MFCQVECANVEVISKDDIALKLELFNVFYDTALANAQIEEKEAEAFQWTNCST